MQQGDVNRPQRSSLEALSTPSRPHIDGRDAGSIPKEERDSRSAVEKSFHKAWNVLWSSTVSPSHVEKGLGWSGKAFSDRPKVTKVGSTQWTNHTTGAAPAP